VKRQSKLPAENASKVHCNQLADQADYQKDFQSQSTLLGHNYFSKQKKINFVMAYSL